MPAPLTVAHDLLWRTHAACFESDPDLWFPESGTAREARAICSSCPVRVDCLEWALSNGEGHGVWGGASERVRRHLRRHLNLSPHPLDPRRRRDCSCSYCAAVGEHWGRLRALERAEEARRLRDNGPGARHGFAATYARGCRCHRCTEAMRESRRVNAERRRDGRAS